MRLHGEGARLGLTAVNQRSDNADIARGNGQGYAPGYHMRGWGGGYGLGAMHGYGYGHGMMGW